MNIATSMRKTHPEALGRVYRRVVLEKIAAQWGIPIAEMKGQAGSGWWRIAGGRLPLPAGPTEQPGRRLRSS